jgi:hypothetical protein
METGMPLNLPAEGGCQCGNVRYRLTGQPLWLGVCHCTECKRASGAAFSMSLRLREADVELLSGTLKQWSRPSAKKGEVICEFCPDCGNRVWHVPVGTGFKHVKPGTLDDPSAVAPNFEGWTVRKAPWLSISGLAASFEEQ